MRNQSGLVPDQSRVHFSRLPQLPPCSQCLMACRHAFECASPRMYGRAIACAAERSVGLRKALAPVSLRETSFPRDTVSHHTGNRLLMTSFLRHSVCTGEANVSLGEGR